MEASLYDSPNLELKQSFNSDTIMSWRIGSFLRNVSSQNLKTVDASFVPFVHVQIMGLDVCAHTIAGDQMRRGI
jgi:hypothetical protein